METGRLRSGPRGAVGTFVTALVDTELKELTDYLNSQGAARYQADPYASSFSPAPGGYLSSDYGRVRMWFAGVTCTYNGDSQAIQWTNLGIWSPDVNPTYRSDIGGSYEFNVGSNSGGYTTQYLGSCGVPPTFLPEVPMFIDSNKEAVTISAGEVAINMGKLELHSVLTLATKDDVACAESWISLSGNSNACRSTYGLKVGINGDTGSTHGKAKNSGGIQLLKKGSVSYSTSLAAGSTVVISVSSTRGQAGDMVIATATNYQDNSISGYQHFTWHGTMTNTDGSIGHGDSSRSAWAILLKNVCTPCGYVAPLNYDYPGNDLFHDSNAGITDTATACNFCREYKATQNSASYVACFGQNNNGGHYGKIWCKGSGGSLSYLAGHRCVFNEYCTTASDSNTFHYMAVRSITN